MHAHEDKNWAFSSFEYDEALPFVTMYYSNLRQSKKIQRNPTTQTAQLKDSVTDV